MKAIIILLPAILTISACTSKADHSEARKEIIALLQQERKAHFDKDVDLFMSEFADGMISVNKGKVTSATVAENKERIGKYFGRVEFVKWDDMAEPLIRFSDDASLAYAIIQKKVVLRYTDSPQPVFDSVDYAWISVYRKHQNKWKVECNVSTNQ